MQTNPNEPTEEIETASPQETSVEESLPDGDSGSSPDAEGVVMELGGQRLTFKTDADALAYARTHIDKIDAERAIADAYRAGIQDAHSVGAQSSGQPAPAAPPEDELTDEEFYANPTQTLKKVEERARKKALSEIQQSTAAQQREREVWETFCGQHPDLADFRTDVELIANDPQYTQIIQALAQTKGQIAAMSYVAQKTRAKFQAYAEKSKSATVLPRGSGVGSAPSGTKQSVTPQKKPAKPLSMADQIRQIRSKGR